MKTQCSETTMEFKGVGQRKVVADFSGGTMTSDGGAVLLEETEELVGVVKRLAGCFTDHRDAERVEHSVVELVRQRVFGLALGYEDLNDHDELSRDPLLATVEHAADGLDRGRVVASPHAMASQRRAGACVPGTALPHAQELEPGATRGGES